MDDITTFIWKGLGPPIVYEYRPEICVCKRTYTYPPARNGSYIMPAGGTFLGNMTQKYTNTDGGATQEDNPSEDDYVTGKQVPYNSILEQSGIVTRGVSNSQGCFMAPTLGESVVPVSYTHLDVYKRQLNILTFIY